MIRRSHRCFVCGLPATRAVDIDGRSAWLCNDCPDETEVYQRASQLREAWPAWRWRQARRDERHGDPITFDQVVHLEE